MYVSECYADGGPVLKRVRPRAKGRYGSGVVGSYDIVSCLTVLLMLTTALRRGNAILKPMVHMTVALQEKS